MELKPKMAILNKWNFRLPARTTSYAESLTWLLSSMLFFFISVIIGPKFWFQLSQIRPGAGSLPLNRVFGIAGIIIYVLEPVTWHYQAFVLQHNPPDVQQKEAGGPLTFIRVIDLCFSLIAGMLIAIPYVFLLIFKPVLRALILYTSLSYLGNIQEGSILYRFFTLAVSADILLYYLGLLAPQWKYNPVHALSRLIRFQRPEIISVIARLLLVIHTALIYTLLLTVVYFDAQKHPGRPAVGKLLFWWFLLTVYCRAAFTNPDNGFAFSFLQMDRRRLLLHFLALVISFLAFLWPFYFAG